MAPHPGGHSACSILEGVLECRTILSVRQIFIAERYQNVAPADSPHVEICWSLSVLLLPGFVPQLNSSKKK